MQKEAADDPIKKAELIRNMVASIAKIPDAIKREVYIRECATIMQISEEVLFSSLAQLIVDNSKEATKKGKASTRTSAEVVPPMSVHKNTPENTEKVDVLFELERSIIGILLLYCLLYTSPSPRDQRGSRMPSSA